MHGKITIPIGASAISVSTAPATESSVPHLNADQVRAFAIDGFGVTVAVIDTGVDFSDFALLQLLYTGTIPSPCDP
jgi:hypothetical protein